LAGAPLQTFLLRPPSLRRRLNWIAGLVRLVQAHAWARPCSLRRRAVVLRLVTPPQAQWAAASNRALRPRPPPPPKAPAPRPLLPRAFEAGRLLDQDALHAGKRGRTRWGGGRALCAPLRCRSPRRSRTPVEGFEGGGATRCHGGMDGTVGRRNVPGARCIGTAHTHKAHTQSCSHTFSHTRRRTYIHQYVCGCVISCS
jgi:hypothetical protein